MSMVCPSEGFAFLHTSSDDQSASSNDGIECGVYLPPLQDVLRLLVLLETDGMAVCACGGNEEEQRLRPRIAGAFGHDIE